MVYTFIQTLTGEYPLKRVCQLLGVSRSSYYEFACGNTFKITEGRGKLTAQVTKVFAVNRKRYGSRRVMEELKKKGVKIGRYLTRSILREQNLVAIQPKSFVPKTTNSNHHLGYSPNVLGYWGKPVDMGEVYVGDITYLPTAGGDWLYLMTWMDLWSRSIVGWKIADHMEESLVIEATQRAFDKRRPLAGLIIHSDRGGQFASAQFRAVLARYKCIQSMSNADNPYDNAYAESFFGRFKTELLQKGAFQNIEEANIEVFDYIEMYYNTHRLHSSLGYKSPLEFEQGTHHQQRTL